MKPNATDTVKIWNDGELLICDFCLDPTHKDNDMGLFKVRHIIMSNNTKIENLIDANRFMLFKHVVHNFKIPFDEFKRKYPEYLC